MPENKTSEGRTEAEGILRELKEPEKSQRRSEERAAARPLDLLCPSKEVLEWAKDNDRRLLFAAPDNVELHKMEGYEVVAAKGGDAVKSREMVLMAVSEERAREYERAVNAATKAQTESIVEHMEQRLDEVVHAMKRAGYSSRQVEEMKNILETKAERGE